MMSSESRLALVTGASRQAGIGAAVARTLARDGCSVFITYYRPYDLEAGLAGKADEHLSLLSELKAIAPHAEALEVDLAKPEAAHRLFNCVEAALGPVSILVNNATYSARDGIENLQPDHLDRHYAVNIRGMALLCAEFVRRYRQYFAGRRGGRIINLSSGQGLGAMPGELAYAATKGAVEAFSRSLSAEVGGLGITVNSLDPGITDTGWISPESRRRWEADSPLGRVGVPDDAARVIRFLASNEAEWITGQVIHSRGGL